VLMGVDTLWEGIDIPGPAVTLLVLVRLPFAVPSHPLTKARIDEIARRGGNAFANSRCRRRCSSSSRASDAWCAATATAASCSPSIHVCGPNPTAGASSTCSRLRPLLTKCSHTRVSKTAGLPRGQLRRRESSGGFSASRDVQTTMTAAFAALRRSVEGLAFRLSPPVPSTGPCRFQGVTMTFYFAVLSPVSALWPSRPASSRPKQHLVNNGSFETGALARGPSPRR
jgi:hypothetical protein